MRKLELVENEDTIERLYFHLSSETRLGILRKLQKSNLRMPELTRDLELTATETFRQLQRLSEAKLVQKNLDGTFSITQFGKLTLAMTASLEFIYKNKQYFLEHAIFELPPVFLNRIGELSNSVFISEMAAVMNAIERIISEARSYVWIMTDQILESHTRLLTERRHAGVHFRSLLHEKLHNEELAASLYKGDVVERRFLTNIPAVLVITENEAAFSLFFTNGKLDPTGFFSKDMTFVRWSSDLFIHYWEQGTRAQSFGMNPK